MKPSRQAPEPASLAQPPGQQESFETRSVRGTVSLGRKLAERFDVGHCVSLCGQLGAGKTALVRGIAAGLGLADDRLVSSPTFVLVQEYPCRMPVYHVDLYRMVHPDAELADLGLEEMLADGIVLIEWADRATAVLPAGRWKIHIEITGPRAREFIIHRRISPQRR